MVDAEILAEKRERSILIATCSAHAFTHLYILLSSGVLLGMQSSYGLERDELLGYVTLSHCMFGLGAVPSGWLGDRFGEKPMMILFFFLTAIGGIVVGLSSSLLGLGVGMFVMGCGTSIYHPVGISLISKGIANPGKALGINGLWGSIGAAAGPFLAVQLMFLQPWIPSLEPDEAWRSAYLVLAIPMVGFGIFSMRAPLSTDDTVLSDAEIEQAGKSWRSLLQPKICLLLLAMTFGGFYFNMTTVNLPDYLRAEGGFAVADAESYAATTTAIILLLGGIGQVIAGNLMDQREGRGLYVLILFAAAPLMFLMSLLSGYALMSVATLMAITMFMVQPVENTLLSRYSPRHLRGLIFGGKFVLVFGVGGLGPWLSGALAESYSSLSAVYVGAAMFTFAAGLIAIIAWRVKG